MTKRKRDLKRRPLRTDVAEREHRALLALAADTDRSVSWHMRAALERYKPLQRYLQDADEVHV